MLQNLQNFAEFQKFQLDNLVDFEKCWKTRICLERSMPIKPKTSENLPKICQKLATTLRVYGRWPDDAPRPLRVPVTRRARERSTRRVRSAAGRDRQDGLGQGYSALGMWLPGVKAAFQTCLSFALVSLGWFLFEPFWCRAPSSPRFEWFLTCLIAD